MWPFGFNQPLGPRGETLAVRLLKRKGLRILARNYRCPAGEIDVVALDASTRKALGAETLVFVEVKTRSSERYTAPESAVDADKRRRMAKVADYYLNTHAATPQLAWRFDIVAVVAPPGRRPEVRHHADAF